MVARTLLLTILFAGVAGAQPTSSPSVPTAEEDLAWLNRYLSANAANRSTTRVRSGAGVAFAELKQHIGAPLRVTLKNGSSRFGTLTEADTRAAKLRVRVGAGDYLFGFAADDVSHIEER